ncbi:MAG: type II secretion system protein [Phycisphaerae bacterium]|nr:type II secretion system protein [Phycisphaerae bacterium]MDD5381260.1 type II secretion system protein [Phycisphaerae bacterium]
MKAKSGFTLVEILIVVVILGILAAIVIPQFTDASEDAKESALLSNLQTMRGQIELYKAQHNGALPGAGTAAVAAALTGRTDVDGAADAAGAYGPYMQKIPANPFNELNTIDEDGTAGDDSHGWNLVTTGANIGLFQADDSDDPNHVNL